MVRVTAILFSCLFVSLSNISTAQEKLRSAGTIVYKTKKDYRHLVPVTLSDDKQSIVAYPAPSDLTIDGKLAEPTKLKRNYFLDNRGIGANTAFINMTYSEYAALKEVPTLEDMYAMIVDKDPITEMCNCGERTKYDDPKKDLNKLIRKKRLKQNCEIIK